MQDDSMLVMSIIVSVGVFVATLIAIPIAIVRLPVDYFSRPPSARRSAAMLVLKNILGVVLVLLGLAMLVLPGQGILTLIAGLVLLDFPGRERVVAAMIRRPEVQRTTDALRRRAGKPPMQWPTVTRDANAS